VVKKDLVDELVEVFAGITKKDMLTIVNTVFESMTEGLGRGEAIDLRGLGRLTVRKRRPITGRNPRTAMSVDLPLRWVVHFKPSNSLAQKIREDSAKQR
jgi:integration host factor subunit beta